MLSMMVEVETVSGEGWISDESSFYGEYAIRNEHLSWCCLSLAAGPLHSFVMFRFATTL